MTTRVKPQNPKGTRDFLPQEVARRNFIFNTIKSVFRKYGFQEIETPAIERLETLTGKYGDEGDKLLFKILNSGDYFKDVPADAMGNAQLATKYLAEKGLRYDLTVPLARYVVQHQDGIVFPFKRFHIGPVWRADRPQKGRYQEFYQCDADIIGSTSLINEVELTMIYAEVFEKLGMDVTIKINNRKVLEGIVNAANCPELLTEVTIAIDKLDKIGPDGVRNELAKANLTEQQIKTIEDLLTADTLASIQTKFANNEIGLKGVSETEYVLQNAKSPKAQFDVKLARGLNYYTGVIWEVAANGVQMGSIASGGRYDNLTEMFGGQNMSGVGISFGIERIYDVMDELNLFPNNITEGATVLLVPRDAAVEDYAFGLTQQLRQAGISAEIFLGNVKKQKHFTYAETKNIKYMVEVGANEKESGNLRLRNVMERKEEGNGFTIEQLIPYLV